MNFELINVIRNKLFQRKKRLIYNIIKKKDN